MSEKDPIIDYERLLQAVGRYIQREHLKHVCVLEVEGGVLVQGLSEVDAGESMAVVTRTQTLDRPTLHELLRQRR